jgi:hypothetical protein
MSVDTESHTVLKACTTNFMVILLIEYIIALEKNAAVGSQPER